MKIERVLIVAGVIFVGYFAIRKIRENYPDYDTSLHNDAGVSRPVVGNVVM